ncbi:hypothetical protein ABID08_004847 [Rhizobium binae]|uniref:Uncharacterized protein n=1 Tax=Rhizobium binae TaxID=1138190 RepID=A0ABV2MM25_9HYPH
MALCKSFHVQSHLLRCWSCSMSGGYSMRDPGMELTVDKSLSLKRLEGRGGSAGTFSGGQKPGAGRELRRASIVTDSVGGGELPVGPKQLRRVQRFSSSRGSDALRQIQARRLCRSRAGVNASDNVCGICLSSRAVRGQSDAVNRILAAHPVNGDPLAGTHRLVLHPQLCRCLPAH